jgi:precorrin-4 methylase
MPQSKVVPLPRVTPEYDSMNESATRLTIEHTLQEVKNDVVLAKTQGDKDGSLAMRRFQFLLMGAS